MVLIFIIPIIVFISAVSDPWTHLISTPIVAPGVVEGVMFKREIMSIVGLIYGFSCAFLTIFISLYNIRKVKKSKRKALYLMLISLGLGLIAAFALILNVTEYNFVPMGCFIGVIFLFIQYSLLKLLINIV